MISEENEEVLKYFTLDSKWNLITAKWNYSNITGLTFIKNSPIIVLGEATAFSDPENEYLIQKAFEKLMQNKTVIIIAHRLSTIRNADKIIVMENGHLIECGDHNSLIQKNGRYHQMWQHYTEAIDWKINGKAVQ